MPRPVFASFLRLNSLISCFWLLQALWPPASINAGVAKPQWQIEWEKTVEEAKKEGRVVIYCTSSLSAFAGEFEKDYPEIKVVVGGIGSASQRAQLLFAERRAKKYVPDILLGSPGGVLIQSFIDSGAVDSVAPVLLLPEVVDQSKWWRGHHHYLHTEDQYFFAFEGIIRGANIMHNTKLVNPKGLRSYWDLLDPKWKGKIVLADPTSPRNTGLILLYHHPELGPRYLAKLIREMDVTVNRNVQQATDWIAAGKYPIAFFVSQATSAIKAGLPIKELSPIQFKEGGMVSQRFGVIALVNRAPHPNAAKVFVNWVLSRKGQMTYQRIMAPEGDGNGNSMREDIPKDIIPPEYRRHPGARHLVPTSEMHDTRPIFKFVNELLAASGK